MKENQRVTITKRMLKEGLLRLLQTKNLDEIRINELCEESGINRATFYRHYETPKDILLELERDFIMQASSHARYPQNEKEMRRMLENTCTYCRDHIDVTKVLLRCNTEEDMLRRFQEFYSHFIEMLETGEQFSDMDEDNVKMVVAFMGGGAYYLLRQWILEDIQKTPKEIADILYQLTYGSFAVELLNGADK